MEVGSIIIAKNGRHILELCYLYHGYGIYQHAIKHVIEGGGRYYSIISAERFAYIIDEACKRGYDIFDYLNW